MSAVALNQYFCRLRRLQSMRMITLHRCTDAVDSVNQSPEFKLSIGSDSRGLRVRPLIGANVHVHIRRDRLSVAERDLAVKREAGFDGNLADIHLPGRRLWWRTK